MATLKDVARLAQVDVSTVSRVLRSDPAQAARPETVERIRAAARELDYRPNGVARALRTRRSKTLALLVHDLENLGFSEATRGLRTAAAELGYLLVLGEVASGSREAKAYARLVDDGRVEGLLVAFAEVEDEVVREIAGRGLPLVLVQRRVVSTGVSVIADDALGSRLAVEHLAALGHHRIAHIRGQETADTALRRLEGYQAGMAALGLEQRSQWVANGCFTLAGGYEAAERLAQLQGDARPTAIYAANLMSGLGALAAFHALGVRIPDQMSMVVMDEHPIAAQSSPPLTTVQLPLFQVGFEAVRLLVSAIEGERLSSLVVPDRPRLVVRRSTAPPPSG